MVKGQVAITFNWIYILIAGVVILLFFFFIVAKQKEISEEKLGADLVRTMKSIFTAAGVSEKTKNEIDTGSLADYTLFFNCEDGRSEFGFLGTSARDEDRVNPLFSPAEIKAPKLITWSLPYKLPFKVADLLYVSSSTTKYFAWGQGEFRDEFVNAAKAATKNDLGFNVKEISNFEEYNEVTPQLNFQVRILDLDGSLLRLDRLKEGELVPPGLKKMADTAVTAVSLDLDGHNVFYFQKEGDHWKQSNRNPIPIVSLGEERDAAKYAALFAADEGSYECNMKKAFRRLQYVAAVYEGKAQQLSEGYQDISGQICRGLLSGSADSIQILLSQRQATAVGCEQQPGRCADLVEIAWRLKQQNEQLNLEDCVTLY